MKPRVRLTRRAMEIRDRLIAEAYEREQLSTRALGKRFGICAGAVAAALLRRGVPLRTRGGKNNPHGRNQFSKAS